MIYTYPIRFTYKRLCDICEILVECKTTIFEPGKVLYRGACGHSWDIHGKPLNISRWLDDNKKFTLHDG